MAAGIDGRRRIGGQRILGLALLISALLVPFEASGVRADELDHLFDQLVASAESDEQRIENAKLLREKATEFPDRRKGIEARALKLAREAEQPESLPIIEGIYRYWLEQPGTPNEKVYAVLIKDFRDALSWKMDENTKLAAARKVLTFYEASAEYLTAAERYTEAAQVLDGEKDFVRKFRKAVDPGRNLYKALKGRIDDLEDLAEKKAEREALLAEAKANPEDADLNAKAGIALFNEDKLAQALPFLTRGGQTAQVYLSIAEKLEPLYNPRTPGGTTQAMLDKYESVLGDLEQMLPLAKEMMNDPDLQRPAAEVVVYIQQEEPLAGRGEKLLEAGRALLLEQAVRPEPLALYEAAKALAALAQQDDDFGEKGMAERSRFYLWKATKLYADFLREGDKEQHKTQLAVAQMQAQVLGKALALAGGYEPGPGGGAAAITAKPGSRWVNSLGMEFSLIPAGAFWMGTERETVETLKRANDFSPNCRAALIKNGGLEAETPRHRVIITYNFLMARYEVTNELWETATGTTIADFDGRIDAKDLSAKRLNTPFRFGEGGFDEEAWEAVGKFFKWLNQNDTQRPRGWVYRLPTEAEWEYACRAGSDKLYILGDDANVLKELLFSGEVGQGQPNAWELYNVLGSVGELVLDAPRIYDDQEKIDPVGYLPENMYTKREEYDPRGYHTRGNSAAPQASVVFYRPACRAMCGHMVTGIRVVLAPEGKPDLSKQEPSYKSYTMNK